MMPKARRITRRTLPSPPAPPVLAVAADRLLGDVRALIEAAREQTARAVNSALVGLYWHIGTRIRQDILREKRAGYGEEIVATLSRQLTAEFGRGYTEKGLRRMIQFAESFPRWGNCRGAVARIVLESVRRTDPGHSRARCHRPMRSWRRRSTSFATFRLNPANKSRRQSCQFARLCDERGLCSLPAIVPLRQLSSIISPKGDRTVGGGQTPTLKTFEIDLHNHDRPLAGESARRPANSKISNRV